MQDAGKRNRTEHSDSDEQQGTDELRRLTSDLVIVWTEERVGVVVVVCIYIVCSSVKRCIVRLGRRRESPPLECILGHIQFSRSRRWRYGEIQTVIQTAGCSRYSWIQLDTYGYSWIQLFSGIYIQRDAVDLLVSSASYRALEVCTQALQVKQDRRVNPSVCICILTVTVYSSVERVKCYLVRLGLGSQREAGTERSRDEQQVQQADQ